MPRRQQADQSDAVAIAQHQRLDARPAHAVVAERTWTALRALGVTGGTMLVRGTDPAPFLGFPPHAPQLTSPPDGTVATIPPIGVWPHPASIRPRYVPDKAARFDVVLANMPLADLPLTSPIAVQRRRLFESRATTSALARTAPGGLTAVIASHHLLDDPDPTTRQTLRALGDVVGAIRLPSAALRPGSTADQPCDLILLRRRGDFEDRRGPELTASVTIPELRRARVNEYFANHPTHVLGALAVAGSRLAVVTDGDASLSDRLGQALGDVVERARANGLSHGVRAYRAPAASLGASERTRGPAL